MASSSKSWSYKALASFDCITITAEKQSSTILKRAFAGLRKLCKTPSIF